MVVVRSIADVSRVHSLCGLTKHNLNIEPTYYNSIGIGKFNTSSHLWDPDVDNLALDCTMPLILHTNNSYLQVNAFTCDAESYIYQNIAKKNAIFVNKSMELTI